MNNKKGKRAPEELWRKAVSKKKDKLKASQRTIKKKAKEIKRSDTFPALLYEKMIDEQEELGFKTFNEYLIALLDERFETVEKIRYRRSLSRGK